ncbi:hypothetical protein RHMOL_Rhmol02G0174900 [Rhododendron molle]|uniref:Uncharacterized protein n=1 Tax=Rhododendron molle TaxID=49168 RepID=A0ACC0PSL2_RHOML|nr:hypothetical protein RHMOL_Rhmol02G0174900 [Rhododendron molle]
MKPYMKIRWNSTFLMLKSCRNHTVVITAFVNAKSVMDPRTKLEDVQMLLEGISDNLMITLPSCTKVKSQLTNLYASYESKFASSTTTTSTTTIPLTSTSNNDPS